VNKADTTYFVLPEGAATEEEFSWESIEEGCRDGRFTPDTRIFFPDKNTWVRAGDCELKSLFNDGEPAPGDAPAVEDEEGAEATALEAEYAEALKRVGLEPGEPDAYVEAGRLAAELGDREAARGYFQKALRMQPFNSRVAKEVMRRFSKSECRSFVYLRRDPAVWDEPADLLAYPFAAGPLYLAIPAAVILVMSFIPYGVFVAGPLAFLWFMQMARRVSEGSTTPPQWQSALANPARNIILPLVAGAALAVECVLLVYGVGRLSMVVTGSEGSAFATVAESPVLSVTLAVAGLLYVPAVLTKLVHSAGIVVHLLNPLSVVRSMVSMDQEYVVSALTVMVAASVLGAIRLLLGGIPVIGNLVFAAVATLSIPVSAMVVGRLAGRMPHVL
jgi:hypothetical protein